jgi:uncharacterized membrane protein
LAGFWRFVRARKRFWLPIVVLTAIFAGLILLSQGLGLTPFTYTKL